MRPFFSSKLTICCVFVSLRRSSSLLHTTSCRGWIRMATFASKSEINGDKNSSLNWNDPITVGLTGSIGMGKSTIAKQFIRLGIPVFDADQAVHELYARGGEAVQPLSELFPDVTTDGAIDRSKLSSIVLSDSSALKKLESVVHPLVGKKRDSFYSDAKNNHSLIIVYDIPLLFENRNNYRLDYVIVVSASEETQRERVLKRPNMTVEKFQAILGKQVPDATKRQLADFVISTDYKGYAEGRAQLAQVLESILVKEENRYRQWMTRPHTVDTKKPWDAVVFDLDDLDDTLAPSSGPLKEAYNMLMGFMGRSMPNTMKAVKSNMPELLYSYTEYRCKLENPLIAHDLTEVRATVLRQAAKAYGEDAHVDALMEEFLKVRSNITPFLYPDTLSCLDYFKKQNVSISVFTNGNARNTSLHEYTELFLSATDIGASKPAPVGFVACCLLLSLPPHRILYIGDSYEKDIVGAKAIGMKTALLLRDKEAESADKTTYPDADMIWYSLNPQHIEEESNKFLG